MAQLQSEPDRPPAGDAGDRADQTEAPPTEPSGDRHRAPEIKRPSASRRLFYNLFNRDTRGGRFLRALASGLALFIGLTALGAFAVYQILYQPAAQRLNETSRRATQTAQELEQAQRNLDSAQQQAEDAQADRESMASRLETELARIEVLRAVNHLTLARMAILNEDQAAAVQALDESQAAIEKIQPVLEQKDPEQVSTLQALYTLAKNDLERDLDLAAQDLDRLEAELNRAEENVLK